MGMTDRKRTVIVSLVAGLLGFGLVAYLFSGRSTEPSPTPAQTAAQSAPQNAPPAGTESPRPQAAEGSAESVMEQIFGMDQAAPSNAPPESLAVAIPKIVFRIVLAALLAAMLAYRRRKDVPVIQRNPFVAQTQILLAVVASALMMVVGDNAARAFGIFAAASLVRFRTNISDPKEITVLLICLAIGLATGVGRWELAIVLGMFMLLLLWVLEYYEPGQITRAMELRVTTRNIDATHVILKRIIKRHRFGSEVRELNREDEQEPFGRIVYCVNVSANVSTDQLCNEIMSLDKNNHIDAIEWQQTKSASYIYR